MIRKVAVIMGSDSDWPVVKGACAQLKALDIPFEAHILSAHRTPAEAADFAKKAKADAKAAEEAKKTEAESVLKKLLAEGMNADEILGKRSVLAERAN